jgi:hypothetical protein
MVVTCPPRDCWNREGVMWLEARVFDRREAELQERVDRRRIRVVYAAERETNHLRSELEAFRGHVSSLEDIDAEASIVIDTTCVTPEVSVAEELEA